MNHPMFWLYVFTRLDPLRGLFCGILVISLVAGLVSIVAMGVASCESEEEYATTFKKAAKSLLYTALFCGLALVIVPTQRAAAIMLGGSLAVDAIKSPVVGQTAAKVNELIQGTLDNAIADLRKKEKDKE